MAAPGIAPIQLALETPSVSGPVPTHALLAAMLRATDQVSDLIFSPGRPPQVEVYGQLIPVQAPGLQTLNADDTRRIASDLIGNNKQAITTLREQGSCDISFGLPGLARFRVNVFIQRGSCAVVMRVIPTSIPDFASLGLPRQLLEIANLRDGIVLVTGPRGSGKSSTLAALLDCINQRQTCHIITIEDPIEFLHNHKRATIHQRELHSDTPSFALALRAALRQAPKVILLGEMRDRETMEMVLEAAETGHLVLSSLNTLDAAKTVERIVSAFDATERGSIRSRLAKTVRYIVSQRLIPRADGNGCVAVIEILKSGPRTGQYIEHDDHPGQLLHEAIKNGAAEGMQYFDGEIVKLVQAGVVDTETALAYATDAQALRHALGQ
jgi:twitching motility protein PilT